MDNQHRAIKTYRELSPEEIALINRVKDHEAATEALVKDVRAHLEKQLADAQAATAPGGAAEVARIAKAEPGRWASLARTDFQTAHMALVRAIAQPGS
jgi:hypothetical protein